jgi:hypothetical protein
VDGTDLWEAVAFHPEVQVEGVMYIVPLLKACETMRDREYNPFEREDDQSKFYEMLVNTIANSRRHQ